MIDTEKLMSVLKNPHLTPIQREYLAFAIGYLQGIQKLLNKENENNYITLKQFEREKGNDV